MPDTRKIMGKMVNCGIEAALPTALMFAEDTLVM